MEDAQEINTPTSLCSSPPNSFWDSTLAELTWKATGEGSPLMRAVWGSLPGGEAGRGWRVGLGVRKGGIHHPRQGHPNHLFIFQTSVQSHLLGVAPGSEDTLTCL